MNWASEWRELNRAKWDERVAIHVAGDFYDVEGFLAGASRLLPFELDELGSVDGRRLIHPQCHFGLDTLSWARRGAQVTGLDFSGPAITAARDVAARAGIAAEFIEADVYDAPAAVSGRVFDVVYTGLGAINWLPDIEGWARTMATLLAPRGIFYMAEFHPLTEVFGDDDLAVEHPYFQTEAQIWDEPGTYADLAAETTQNRSVEWVHTLGAVVSALAGAGLVIELLHEHDFTLTPRWPFLEQANDRTYHLPAAMPSLPLMYSIRASRR